MTTMKRISFSCSALVDLDDAHWRHSFLASVANMSETVIDESLRAAGRLYPCPGCGRSLEDESHYRARTEEQTKLGIRIIEAETLEARIGWTRCVCKAWVKWEER